MEEFIVLQSPGVQVSTFADGLSVLSCLNASQDAELPSLIILDYYMPNLTGAEVLTYLKGQQRFSAIPKIIISTSDAPINIKRSLSNGATEYYIKPASLNGLQKLV